MHLSRITQAKLASSKLDDDIVTLEISDTSGGIPENEQPFLFDPSKSSKKGGTGLGLAIAHQLSEYGRELRFV